MTRWTLIGILTAMLAGCFEAIYRLVIDTRRIPRDKP